MTRTHCLSKVLCLALLTLVYVSPLAAQRSNDARPMNLLIIQTDEHHFGTLGCYGGTIVDTPNIDWIAKNGAICTSFYATTPVCTPSRGALVTGLYPQKTGIVSNNIPMPDDAITFAKVLADQGYATGFAGKWHLNGDGKPEWAPSRKFGFEDNRFMFNRGHWKRFVDTEDGPRVGAQNQRGQPSYDLNDADDKTFSTDWLCDKAVDFIQANQDQPFCYFLSLPDPHGPNTVRAPYDTMYADVEIPIPNTIEGSPGSAKGWRKGNGVTAAQLRRIMPAYYGMVKCIDDNVGKILTELRESGMIDNTIIVFTSDHGDLCGEHGRLNKGVPFEGSARIPFLIRCPGQIDAGYTVDEALTCVDFFPTVMTLLNVDHDVDVDGRDASLIMQGIEEETWEDVAFIRGTGNSGWLCAVSARYKLVLSNNDEPWLLDLEKDPDETINCYDNSEYASVVQMMRKQLKDYARQHQEPFARQPGIRDALADE